MNSLYKITVSNDIITEVQRFKDFGEIQSKVKNNSLYKYLRYGLLTDFKHIVPEIKLDAELERRMFIALYEAIDNALKHGRPPTKVALLASRRRVSILVEDKGEKFNVPSVEDKLGKVRSNGWGFVLIKKFCDKVIYLSENGTNKLYLIFYLPQR